MIRVITVTTVLLANMLPQDKQDVELQGTVGKTEETEPMWWLAEGLANPKLVQSAGSAHSHAQNEAEFAKIFSRKLST
jgi:hypothetical protein